MNKDNRGRMASTVLTMCAMAVALHGQTLATLYSFGDSGGTNPYAPLVQGANGSFFATTAFGGTVNDGGTVFEINASGTLTTLYSFCAVSGCPDGSLSFAGLLQAPSGDFYGTTESGGAHGSGTIFKMTPGGKLTTLYSFCSLSNCADGGAPYAGLALGPNGDLYGTTYAGGTGNGNGTIFKITQGGTLTTLHSFCSLSGCADGGGSQSVPLRAINGNFYGTAPYGGANNGGTVFEVTPDGAFTTIYNFCSQSNCTDGSAPYSSLIQATDGELYGTTTEGGLGNGTIFRITLDGALTTVHTFCSESNCPNGGYPAALTQATDGNLYGTTIFGGVANHGTIFKMTLGGALTTLYRFCAQSGCPDGAEPFAGLLQATSGEIYGATQSGGASDKGTIFSLSLGLGPFVEPQITTGKVGTVVKILGNNLTGATSVSFNGVAAAFTAASSVIITTVPAGATSGTIEVVTHGGTLSSNTLFHVVQ